MLSENGCLEQNVQSEKGGLLNLLEQSLETLKSVESNQDLESLIMNSGVAMKYGNDSSAELSEVSSFSVLVFHASEILFSEYSLSVVLGLQFGLNAIKD